MSTPTSQYFNDISVMRVFAMLLVVLYHCLCPYTSIWDGSPYGIGFHVMAWQVLDGMLMQIHLPIFFLISGYLYGFKRIRGGTQTQSDLCETRRCESCFHTSSSDCSFVSYNIENCCRC